MSDASSRISQTDAERALSKLLPIAAKFQRLLEESIRAKESTQHMLKVRVERGRIAAIELSSSEQWTPKADD